MSAVVNDLGRAWNRAFRFVVREHVLALADQAVVSGTGFLTTLLIARWSGAGQLGLYAVGISLLGSFVTCQDSLILEPYLIQRYYPQGTGAERAGASLTLSVLFSAGSALVLAIAACGFLEWGAGRELVVMTWAGAGIVPFALTRNFARRFSFARLEFRSALLLDIAIASIQLPTLGWLGLSGRVSALSAWAALGGAYALAAAAWLYCTRAEFAVRPGHVRTVFRQTWTLGKWLLAGQITVQVQGNIIYWLSMAIAGASVTGVFAACMSIVAFVNPLLLGLASSMMPRSVLAWKNGGGPELWREAVRNTVLIGALMAAFCVAVMVAGEPAMHFLYRGAEYEGLGHTLTILALATFAGTLAGPPSLALATMERPLAIVAAATVGAVVTVVLVWLLMTEWGLPGAVYGLLGGNVAGTVGRWAFFMRVPKVFRPTPAAGVLDDFAKPTTADGESPDLARVSAQ